jgi:hypothetical protein
MSILATGIKASANPENLQFRGRAGQMKEDEI